MVWMFVLRKKGISPVVATIALALISVTAVGVLASFAIPFVQDQLNEGSACFGLEGYYEFYDEFAYNCYEDNGDETYDYALSIQATKNVPREDTVVNGVQFVFLKEGYSEPAVLVDGVRAAGVRMLDGAALLSVPRSTGEVRTFVIEQDQTYDRVSVHPVLASGRVCERTDAVTMEGFVCEQALP